MITYTKGNLLDSGCDILVNPVNCVGTMGKGIALDFKRRYTRMFDAYKEACKFGMVEPGHVYLWPELADPDQFGYKLFIVNFATKKHWRDPSKYEWISSGLEQLRAMLHALPDKSCAIPALGCGNGGLDWASVKPMIESTLGDLPQQILVYEPQE